jgi:hypothetical protein
VARGIHKVENVALFSAVGKQNCERRAFNTHLTFNFVSSIVCPLLFFGQVPVLTFGWFVGLLKNHIQKKGLAVV